ncbi:hypothetical protein BHE74_00046152, partial [Ensete ventricosum]
DRVGSRMSDLFADGGEGFACEATWGAATPAVVMASASYKGEGKAAPALRRRASMKPNLEVEEFINLLHGSDPVRVELNRLENEVRGATKLCWLALRTEFCLHFSWCADKDRELSEAQSEIKALRLSERAREKAVEEVSRFCFMFPSYFHFKDLHFMHLAVHLCCYTFQDEINSPYSRKFGTRKPRNFEDVSPKPLILINATSHLQNAKLQDDNRALDRLTKSKEAALLEAERTVQIALAKASLVDDLQNKNQDLMKQIEICQVPRRRCLEEMKILDRELARAKVTANRVAVVVANEWKDASDKVMPVKQWLEERRFMQQDTYLQVSRSNEIAILNFQEKFQLRLKVLEEGLRISASGTNRTSVDGKSTSNSPSGRQSLGGADNVTKIVDGFLSKRPSFQMRYSISGSTVLKHAKGASKSFDGGTRSLDRSKVLVNAAGLSMNESSDATESDVSRNSWKENPDKRISELPDVDSDDCVSGLLYDMLQKEVITLRKACSEKDQSLKDKDDAIEVNILSTSLQQSSAPISKLISLFCEPFKLDAGQES